MASLNLIIVSPREIVFEGEVDYFVVPSEEGKFGVLKNHAPIISFLKKGEIVINEKNNSVKNVPVTSGFLKLMDNRAVVMLD